MTSFDIDRENQCRGLGCRLTEELKNYLVTLYVHASVRRGRVGAGSKNSLLDRNEILHWVRGPRLHHPCQIL